MEDIYRLIEMIKLSVEDNKLLTYCTAGIYNLTCPQKASISPKMPKIGLIELIEMIKCLIDESPLDAHRIYISLYMSPKKYRGGQGIKTPCTSSFHLAT